MTALPTPRQAAMQKFLVNIFSILTFLSLTLINADMTHTQWHNFMEMDGKPNIPMDIDNPFLQPRVGDEGANHSHEGGEQDLLDKVEEEIRYDIPRL
jgi:hypothetical protein